MLVIQIIINSYLQTDALIHQLNYDQKYKSPWASNYDIEMEHRRVHRNVRNLLSDLDMIRIISINLIFDDLHIDESSFVNLRGIRKIQFQYRHLMHRYLKYRGLETEFNEAGFMNKIRELIDKATDLSNQSLCLPANDEIY